MLSLLSRRFCSARSSGKEFPQTSFVKAMTCAAPPQSLPGLSWKRLSSLCFTVRFFASKGSLEKCLVLLEDWPRGA